MAPLKNGDFDISSFFELTPDLVCIAGKDGYFRKVNSAVLHKLEYSEEELMQQQISCFIHPDDRELTRGKRALLLEGEALINFQNRYMTKSGKIVWLHWTSVYFPEQEVVFALAKDITEKKLLEQELEARHREFESLARYFKQTMEKDRKFVALELHEELAQLASMVKINMEWLEGHIDAIPPDAKQRMEHVSNLAGRMIQTIRKIAFSFSPAMLDDLGLGEALTVLCREFRTAKGIPCSVRCTLDPSLLTQEAAMDFFRICQEVLDRMERVAAVAQLTILLEREQNSACLRITVTRHESRTGEQLPDLTSVRKRVASMNGQLSVTADGSPAWRIDVCMPLQLEEMAAL
ncbi:sensor histidine kinase [Flaviaesturariibacter terrae]